MVVKTLVCENCKEESQWENGKCPICGGTAEETLYETIEKAVDEMIAEGILVPNKDKTMKYLDFNVYPTREKEENWDIRDDVENAFDWDKESLYGLKWFCSEVDMVVRLYEDGSTKLLEINGVDVSDKNISV